MHSIRLSRRLPQWGWRLLAALLPAALLCIARAQAPAATPKLSAADLDTLLGPIALYPDPLLSIMLPAACYPLEIVEAARFVADTNNIPKIDEQSWDTNVKSVAKIPGALKKLNDDLKWTSSLGQAFLDQQQDVMDAVQRLRAKANTAGTLASNSEQVVVVTNMVVERTVESQVVVVTNTIVQIQPANPQVVYVPQYIPSAVYYPPPAYTPNPLAPLITFGAGIAVGAIIANNCDWHYGGIYVGGGWGGGYYHGGNNININVNNNTIINNRPTQWKPDSNRLRTAGAPGTAAAYQSREARGWGSGGGVANAPGAARPGTFPGGNSRPGGSGAVPSTLNRPSPGNAGAAGARPAPAIQRPAAQPSASAFGGMGQGAATRIESNRGMASRGAVHRGGGGGRSFGGGRRR